MKKRVIAVVALVLVCVFALGACSGGQSLSDSLAQLISGDTTGRIGRAYRTQWFEFTIKSAEPVSEYAGYTAEDGNQLYDVVVSEKNIFDRSIPMGTLDFYMDSDTFYDYVYPLDPIDDTMMPSEFDLAPKESVEYHMVYEVPAGLNDLVLMYTEIDESSTEGATFTVPIS